MTMTGEQCFERWAPDESPWSAWAKPVLFSQIDQHALRAVGAGIDPAMTAALPAFSPETALVVDVAGGDAIRIGIQLARLGWRPVPLFNATTAPKALVNVVPMMELLVAGAEALSEFSLGADAPPAFLLDAQRMAGTPRPGDYDNRSIALPQDFPSATLLRSRGIVQVIQLRESSPDPSEDLRHVLLRWHQGGIPLRWRNLLGGTGELHVSPPSHFRSAWYRMIAILGLRRSNVGGFGAMVPEQTSGGYG